VNSIKLITFS